VSEPFSDQQVLGEGFLDNCANVVEIMSEFVTTLNNICMPDDDHDSSEDEDDEGEEDEPEEEEEEEDDEDDEEDEEEEEE
jgi:hypothetical protein